MKNAILFPGQGSQFTGMGKSFYKDYSVARKIFDEASDILHFDMRKMCFEENEELNLTVNTQPALLTTQIAIYRCLQEEGISVSYCAGLSSGEYSAIVAGGGMLFPDAVRVIKERGRIMQEAAPAGTGMMSAIIGLDTELVERICHEISETLNITNYNCPGQVVIAGYTKDVLTANAYFEKEGAIAVRPLKISVPSHCFLQKDAAKKLEETLEDVTVGQIAIPYISNVTAQEVTESIDIKPLLVEQLYNPVKWQQSLEYLVSKEVDQYYEISADTSAKLFKYIKRKSVVKSIMESSDLYAN